MIRFAPGLLGFILFVVWIYCVFDVIATDSFLARNLPKVTWLFVVVFLPAVGGVAWLALGRPLNAGWRPGDTAVRQRRRVVGIEDSDAWSSQRKPPPSRPARPPTSPPPTAPAAGQQPAADAGAESAAAKERRLMEWEAELKRREERLDDDNS